MALTLDTIVDKTFTIVSEGYDREEVDGFLDEILEEMENREAAAKELEAQIAALQAQLAAAPAAAPVSAEPVKPAARSAESFELVLTKARAAYDEIVAEAEKRAQGIVSDAEKEAASVRADAEGQIADVTAKLDALKAEAGSYCLKIADAMAKQNSALETLKKIL